MKQEIPSKWMPYVNHFSFLKESIDWAPLRQWSLSDVQRVTLKSGETVIAKVGYDSMASELDVYQSLIKPLNLPGPMIYETFKNSTSNAFVMEDLGTNTVEMNPEASHFVNAAKTLAETRTLATHSIEYLNPSTYDTYFRNQDKVLQDLRCVINHQLLYSTKDLRILEHCLEQLPKYLDRLYRKFPVTITHNDYNAKNLMIVNESIVPIDWSNAYLSPHFGDLYCLVHEAKESGVNTQDVINAYTEIDKSHDIEWQIHIGGICWLLRGLYWVCEEGVHHVPVSQSWITHMIASINDCLKQV